jgi:hypothetical protein
LVSYVNGAHPSLYATNASMARLREFTHDPVPKVVFDLAFFDLTNSLPTYGGYLCYRSYRIPDLYAHPVMPVDDLGVTLSAAGPQLQFSADPAKFYTVEASTNNLQWQQIGIPTPGVAPDTFEFLDSAASASTVRFYRIVAR